MNWTEHIGENLIDKVGFHSTALDQSYFGKNGWSEYMMSIRDYKLHPLTEVDPESLESLVFDGVEWTLSDTSGRTTNIDPEVLQLKLIEQQSL